MIEFWDTYRGKVTASVKGKAATGVLLVELPDFRRDIACKVIPVCSSSEARETVTEAKPAGKAPYE